MPPTETALVVGVGPGVGESVARRFDAEGVGVGLLARSADFLDDLATDLDDATALHLDATDADAPDRALSRVRESHGPVDALVLNLPGPADAGGDATAVDPSNLRRAWAQQVPIALRFIRAAEPDLRDGGTVVVTNSMQSKRPNGVSPARASARFALRGLVGSLADGLSDDGIHVAHLVIDGWIDRPDLRERFPDHEPWTDPDAVADTCWHLVDQSGDAWTHELDVRARGDEVRFG
ncbi:SDR family NAD(P)-dependent oxidoreductase [Halostella salina]|uniref:SDR family NAD(P)-dependent oxidoreductase n=1 Tax=Halostella salina TaxID=1547897 RepID=UPI000EF85393|nr:SDR family NAD(P)-dependent oxidoreductase [Halostella salina]